MMRGRKWRTSSKKIIGEAGSGVSEDVSGDSIETASTQAHTHTRHGILRHFGLPCARV